MPIETWLIFILVFMIIGSIVALEIKDILSSIVSIGVVGLALSVAFLMLQAPDLAIVQFLFEIFALIILIRAFLKKDYHKEEPSAINKVLTGVTIITLTAIILYSVPVFKLLPPFGSPLMITSEYYLRESAGDTGAANFVSSIILDYRAYDTLGELTVLFTAILGALTIIRIKSQIKNPEEIPENKPEGMTLIIKTVTRISVWMIMLYGLYIIFHGHLTPGGGFGGGVIIALAFLNIMISFGRNFTAGWLNIGFLHDIEASTSILFIVVGMIGISFGGAFFVNYLSKGVLFHVISSGTILPLNLIIGIKVAMSLFLVVWALAGLKLEKGE